MNSIKEIVIDIISKLSTDEILALKEMYESDLTSLHHTLGQQIRNDYGLWHSSPLTAAWRTDPEGRFMVEGVDYSDDSPDELSSKIILTLWKEVNAKI